MDNNNIDVGSMLNYIGKITDYDIQDYKEALDEFIVYNRLSEYLEMRLKCQTRKSITF